MRILVTGGGGQLADALSVSRELIVLSKDEMDITKKSSVIGCLDRFRPECIINAAAYTAVDAAEENEEQAMAINRDGVAILASQCRERGIRMVHISTDFVFNGDEEGPIGVDCSPDPLSIYGRSKAEGERVCLETLGENCLIVRTAWVYASGHRNFVATMLRLMRELSEISIVDDQYGTPTWAGTLASAVLALVDREATGVHHLTDSGVATWYEFAVAIRELAIEIGLVSEPATMSPISTEDYPTAAVRPANGVLDKRQTFDLLGYDCPPWRESLAECLRRWEDPE